MTRLEEDLADHVVTSGDGAPEPVSPEPVSPEPVSQPNEAGDHPTDTTDSPPSAASSSGDGPPAASTWAPSQWHGRMLVDQQGRHLGKLQDVYVDVETDEPMFATVKEGLWPGRHLTFVPLVDVHVEPKEIRVSTTADRVASAPDLQEHGEELSQGDEAALYHHFGQNYFPVTTVSGRRLARR